jgi:hypothetical protein
VRKALGWARNSSHGLGSGFFSGFFSSFFSLSFSREEEDEDDLDASFFGSAGASAAI